MSVSSLVALPIDIHITSSSVKSDLSFFQPLGAVKLSISKLYVPPTGVLGLVIEDL